MISPCGLYRVVETESRGKIVVAMKDFLPGELVMKETEPLLHISREYMKKFQDTTSHKDALNTACFHFFKKEMSSVAQEHFVSMFRSIHSVNVDQYRESAECMLYSDHDDEHYRSLTPIEIEEYMKIAAVMRLNMFGSEEDGYSLFSHLTLLSHSCYANCRVEVVGHFCWCYARHFIREGEELTVSYLGDFIDSLPTHERRYKYLQCKEFTCHCPRCDAEGDDTRQFDCYNLSCSGVMLACQPCNNDGLSYTGVEYVEPHLLPCTVCHASASVEYQAEMFALESRLIQLGAEFNALLDEHCDSSQANGIMALLLEIEATNFPRRHLKSRPLLRAIMQSKLNIYEVSTLYADFSATAEAVCRDEARRAALDCIGVIERVFPLPHTLTAAVLLNTCSNCVLSRHSVNLPSIFSPQEAKKLLQKTMRMKMLIEGRHKRCEVLDQGLLQALEILAIPQQVSAMEVCAFCEESPLRAALTLSHCGRCRQVVYCSAGCQKAHWKLHKFDCVTEVMK